MKEVSEIVREYLKRYSCSQLANLINDAMRGHDQYTRQSIQRWGKGKQVPGYWPMWYVYHHGTGEAKEFASRILSVTDPDRRWERD